MSSLTGNFSFNELVSLCEISFEFGFAITIYCTVLWQEQLTRECHANAFVYFACSQRISRARTHLRKHLYMCKCKHCNTFSRINLHLQIVKTPRQHIWNNQHDSKRNKIEKIEIFLHSLLLWNWCVQGVAMCESSQQQLWFMVCLEIQWN